MLAILALSVAITYIILRCVELMPHEEQVVIPNHSEPPPNAACDAGRIWLRQETRETLDAMSDLFQCIDREYRYVFVNLAYANEVRATKGDVIGRIVWDVWPDLKVTASGEAYARAFATGARVRYDLYYEAAQRWVEVDAIPMGELLHVYFRDITSKQLAASDLELREREWRWILDAVPHIAWATKRKREDVVYINARWREYTGHATTSGAETLNWIHPDDLSTVRSQMERGGQTGMPETYELRIRGADGEYRWFRILPSPLKGPDGEVDGWICTASDIHEEVLARAAERQSEELYRSTFEHAAVGITHVAPDGHWLSVNQTFCELVGYSKEELRAIAFPDITHPDDVETDLNNARRLLAGEIDRFSMEKRYIRKDGMARWANMTVSLIRDEMGNPLHFISVVEDIQARKEAEESQRRYEAERDVSRAALERAMESLASQAELLELAHDVIFVQMRDGTITYWNSSAESQYGWSREEALGRNVHELLNTVFPIPLPEILMRLDVDGEWQGDLIHTRRDGNHVVVSSKWALRRRRDGLPSEILEIARDVTEERRSQELLREREIQYRASLQKAYAELEERVIERTADLKSANERMETFTYHISHDLRAPLRSIVSTSRILQQDFGKELSAGGHQELERQACAAKSLGILIDDLLKLSRLAREQIERNSIDLSEMAAVLATEMLAEHSGATVRFDIQPDITAFADPRLLRLALQNLIDNAIKYSPNGGEIRIGRRADGVYFVADEGIGMDPKYLSKIFEPFQRLHRNEEFSGTGIGLANVRQVIERHGGRVWAESALGRGSMFFFTLGSS